jgi:hypothetical protein
LIAALSCRVRNAIPIIAARRPGGVKKRFFTDFCGMGNNEKFSVQPFSKGWRGLEAEP